MKIKSQTKGNIILLQRIICKNRIEVIFCIETYISVAKISAQTIDKITRVVVTFSGLICPEAIDFVF